jgi:hypothetical protein
VSPTKLLNVSDQADVNALVVHCSTSWSITFEEETVDRKEKNERRRIARRSMLGCMSEPGRKGGKREGEKEVGTS